MIDQEEARAAYEELLAALKDAGAAELASEIDRVVSAGRVKEEEGLHLRTALPAASALAVGLRMLGAWIEPAYAVSKARALLDAATKSETADIVWLPDRADASPQEPEAAPDVERLRSFVRSFGEEAAGKVREGVMNLYRLADEADPPEADRKPWQR